MWEIGQKGSGKATTDKRTLMYPVGDNHKKGVVMLFDKNTYKSTNGYCSISERLIMVKIKGKPLGINIVQKVVNKKYKVFMMN